MPEIMIQGCRFEGCSIGYIPSECRITFVNCVFADCHIGQIPELIQQDGDAEPSDDLVGTILKNWPSQSAGK